MLEMEREPGGNSRWGENEITAYPWAAHYVPVPDARATLVRELFEEFGVFKDGKWDDRALCFAPQERLYLHGRWQEGIEPEGEATAPDRDEYRRFNTLIQEFRASGEFTIPMERGAKPSALDRITMQEWLAQQKFKSPYLDWYVNYACRDDFGALARDTSAWAGHSLFRRASRSGRQRSAGLAGGQRLDRPVVSWNSLKAFVKPASPVFSITHDARKLRVKTESVEYVADRVIFAAPTFLAPYVIEGASRAEGFAYSPWITANLTIEHPPEDVAWDNVIFESPTLGYVDATHMSLRTFIDRSVWTFYWALAERTPSESRNLLLEKDWLYWREAILNDLHRAHPDIRSHVSRVDIMRIGHAMARPVPGFLASETRRHFKDANGPIYYANSDLSGFSIFEEAQYRGVAAADRALKSL